MTHVAELRYEHIRFRRVRPRERVGPQPLATHAHLESAVFYGEREPAVLRREGRRGRQCRCGRLEGSARLGIEENGNDVSHPEEPRARLSGRRRGLRERDVRGRRGGVVLLDHALEEGNEEV